MRWTITQTVVQRGEVEAETAEEAMNAIEDLFVISIETNVDQKEDVWANTSVQS